MGKNAPRILIDSSSSKERRKFFKRFAGLVAGVSALGGFMNIKAKNTFSGREVSTFISEAPYIGSIGIFGGTFAIRNWALCYGQFLSISSSGNEALFAVIGTTYGGDGRTNFALPDLRGRAIVGAGTGPGLTPRNVGARGGEEYVTLAVSEIPAHTHSVTYYKEPEVRMAAYEGPASTNNPEGNVLAEADIYDITGSVEMDQSALKKVSGSSLKINETGASSSHENSQPYLVTNYQIALKGIFPPRT